MLKLYAMGVQACVVEKIDLFTKAMTVTCAKTAGNYGDLFI